MLIKIAPTDVLKKCTQSKRKMIFARKKNWNFSNYTQFYPSSCTPKSPPFREILPMEINIVYFSKTFFETEKKKLNLPNWRIFSITTTYSTNITVFDFLDFIHFIIYYYSFCFRSKSLFQNHTLKKRNPNPFWYHLSFSYDYWKNDRDLWVSVLFLSLLKIIVQWKKESLKKF